MSEPRYPTDDAPQAADPHVVNEDYWAPIPEALLYDSTISAEAVRVYGVLRRHGDDPRNCYPSHARIAEFIGKSPRSIPGWIRQLEKAGWVKRFSRKTEAGDSDSNAYRVYGRAQQRGVRARQRGGSTPGSAGGSAPDIAPKESKEEREQENERTPALALVSALSFDAFWRAYPRKVGKPTGERAFNAAVKRASPEAIFDGLRRHIEAWRSWPKQKRQFIPYPSTWLNRDAWNDPVEVAETERSRRDQQADAIPELVESMRGFDGFDDSRKALNEG